jgi:hypothetical protein
MSRWGVFITWKSNSPYCTLFFSEVLRLDGRRDEQRNDRESDDPSARHTTPPLTTIAIRFTATKPTSGCDARSSRWAARLNACCVSQFDDQSASIRARAETEVLALAIF